jgi:hypothetical protein
MYHDKSTTISGVLTQLGMLAYHLTAQIQKERMVTHRINVGHSISRFVLVTGGCGEEMGSGFIGGDYQTFAIKNLARPAVFWPLSWF